MATGDDGDGGLAAAQRRLIEDVIVHEARHVDKLDRGRGAHRRISPAPARAEQHEQRPQALSPRGKRCRRVRAERIAVAGAQLSQACLHLAQPSR